MDDPRIERDVDLPAPPEDVWTALTQEIGEWFGAEGEIDASPGGRATFRFPGGTRREAVVEEADPPHRLRLRWMPVEWGPIGDPRLAPASTVTFELVPTDDGTRLTVTEQLTAAHPRELPRRSDAPRGPLGFEARAMAG